MYQIRTTVPLTAGGEVASNAGVVDADVGAKVPAVRNAQLRATATTHVGPCAGEATAISVAGGSNVFAAYGVELIAAFVDSHR